MHSISEDQYIVVVVVPAKHLYQAWDPQSLDTDSAMDKIAAATQCSTCRILLEKLFPYRKGVLSK